MSTVIQQELEQFRVNYQLSLTQFFEDQSIALEESLGKQSQGLSDAVDKFKGVFEEEYSKRHGFLDSLNIQHENLLKSAKTIEHLAEAIGLNKAGQFDELAQVSHSISHQVSIMNKSFEKASKDFSDITSKMKPEMQSYFKRANKGVEEYFKSFDDVSSKIYGPLYDIAAYLITAKKELTARKEQLDNEEKTINANRDIGK
jgi:hypothetical protein